MRPYQLRLFIIGFLCLCCGLSSNNLKAQGISTEGKEFWVGFMTNWLQDSGNPVILELYISADDTTSGVVTMPLQPLFAPIPFTVYPNVTRQLNIPASLAMASGTNIIENKGLFIKSDNTISLYAMNKRQYSADMTVVLPTFSLGNNYYILSHWEDGNRNNNANSDAEFLIVAITDSTEVEILPSVTTLGGNPANAPFRVTLQKGQSYQVRAKADLTGSHIYAGKNSSCNSFAVFSGNMYTQIGKCGTQNGHDHLYAQMYPTNTLGKNFIVVPLENRYGGDVIKLLATQDNTTIAANGQTYVLNAGKFVQLLSAQVMQVSSDKPIAVGQYSRTMDCDGTLGDPFLIPISPNEQMLKKITFNAPSIATLSRYSLNIVIKKADIPAITLDNIKIGGSFKDIDGTDYAYARVGTVGGNHTIRSNGGFIAYVYGFGQNESFGYATGASLGNLNVDFIVKDQNPSTPIDSLCLGSPITFLPVADSIYKTFEYRFGDGGFLLTDKDTAITHHYSKPGEYLVEMKTSTGLDDCSGGNEEISIKKIRVIEPSAKILGPRSVCPNTGDVEYVLVSKDIQDYQWLASGGNITSSVFNDSIRIDWGATNSSAGVQFITTNRYGCIADTVNYPVKINIQLDPEAPFGLDTLCSDAITDIPYSAYFTSASVYQWATDFGSITSGNGTNKVNVSWDSWGIGKLWFNQISVTDTVCDGLSDTLSVYIQRNPSQIGEIITERDTFYLGENIHISLDADTLYRFANWEFDDGTIYDTISANMELSHLFNCDGLHKLKATVYDTGTVCSDTRAVIEKEIFIIPPTVEIKSVSVSDSRPDALVISLLWKNNAFYKKDMTLFRRKAGESGWSIVAKLSAGQTLYTDNNLEPGKYAYEYKIETNEDCPEKIAPEVHQSILSEISQDAQVSATINWSEYIGWLDGVEEYEVWHSIDSGEYKLLEKSSDMSLTIMNKGQGFDHCFYIIARERNGNEADSRSATKCAAFIPEVNTYNIITPNGDKFNEYFMIDNIEHYPKSQLTILNRWGDVLYRATGYTNNWNGKVGGKLVAAGTYYYELELNEPRNETKYMKGFFSVMY
ncbi:MAG: gliding motility-associated C-terminal domain-containing protein [Cyclobacteriaceae bacterium]|nr:gliding motility-associated C-terminal domain-containing protein [Cyclobacteriaceae bacterium]